MPENRGMIRDAGSLLGGCLTVLGRCEEAEPLLVNSYAVIKGEFGESLIEPRRPCNDS